jgi:hypothetical protein
MVATHAQDVLSVVLALVKAQHPKAYICKKLLPHARRSME